MGLTPPRDRPGVEPSLDAGTYRVCHVLCVLLLPAVLLAIHPNLFINPGGNGWLDPWVYTGMFLSLPEHIRRFGDTYYTTRLPWLLPGFVAQRLLSPVAGNYVLHLTFFYAVLLSTYALVSSGVNRSAAFVATVFVAWCPPILSAMSWDYVDGAGLAFAMVALCCMEQANGKLGFRRMWWSLAAGAALTCMIGSNLALIALLPACGAFLVVRAESARWRSTAVILTISLAGAVAMLAFLGLINHSLGGRWLFLAPSVRFGMLIRSAPNPWRIAAFNWSRATWLTLPAFATIGAMLTLAIRRRTAPAFSLAAQTALVVAAATWLVADVGSDAALLQYAYYISYLAPLAVVALAAQAGSPPGGRSVVSVVRVEVLTLVAVGGMHLLMFQHGAPFWRFWNSGLAWTHPTHPAVVVTAVTTGAGLLAILGLQSIRQPVLRWGTFVLGVTLAFGGLSEHWPTRDTIDGRLEFENVVKAHRFIATNIVGQPFRLWYAPATESAPPFLSIACTFLCNRLLINDALPRLTETESAAIPSAIRLVMLVNTQAEAERARLSLRAFGLDYVVVSQEQFGQADRRFLIVIANLSLKV